MIDQWMVITAILGSFCARRLIQPIDGNIKGKPLFLLMFTVYFHSNVFKRRPNGLLMFQSPFDSIPAVLTSGGCQAHQAMAKQRWDMGQRLGTNA